jgi:hypothetical protein
MRFLTLRKLAIRLDKDVRVLARLCGNGTIAAVKNPDGQWLIPATEADRYEQTLKEKAK